MAAVQLLAVAAFLPLLKATRARTSV